jgi:hypothetical protein
MSRRSGPQAEREGGVGMYVLEKKNEGSLRRADGRLNRLNRSLTRS